MADNFQKKFPQYLTAPFQVLFYETDELGVMMIMLLFALMYSKADWIALTLWISVLVVPYMYSHVKRSRPRGFLQHCLYYVGILDFKGYPGFFDNKFFE